MHDSPISLDHLTFLIIRVGGFKRTEYASLFLFLFDEEYSYFEPENS